MTMRTPTPEEMETRIARFYRLVPLDVQRQTDVPQDVMDIIYSRKLLPVITRNDPGSPFGKKAPIVDAAGITVTYAVCPPGTGPSLHSHKRTFETFTVMQGRFEFSWGEAGEHSVVLERFDALSMPPNVHRAFKNVSAEEGILQVLISGGVHDSRDIEYPRKTAEEIRARDPKYLDFFREKAGLDFE